MTPRVAMRLVRLGYAAAAGAGIGSFLFWTVYWFSFVRGNLRGPDFFNFYAAARLYVSHGGSAVYDIAMQRQVELQVTGQDPSRFVVLPYFHPPYYTLLIAPLGYLDYRTAYYVMAAVNVVFLVALVAVLVRSSLRVHGRAALVAAAMIGGFFPAFVTVLQGQSDLVVLLPLAAAYAAWAKGRLGMAGAFAALALAKPQLLLLIPVLFIARRAWRALASFAAVLAGHWLRPTRSRPEQPLLQQRSITTNPTENPVYAAAISPDGRYLAYADFTGVFVRLLETGETHSLPLPEGFCFR